MLPRRTVSDPGGRARPIQAWLLACAAFTLAGWGLSLAGRLDRGGYLVALPLMVALGAVLLRGSPMRRLAFTRCRRRFRRAWPMAFLALTVLIAIGGLLYPPSNFDGLAYRIPRVLNWLSERGWHWIPDHRGWLNTRACGFEWLTAPVLLFTRSDRLLFLVNLASYLLLPGLTFSFFRRTGLSARWAWWWMWLAPAGLCFALQAGSIGNDLYGVVLALAALDFALRAAQRQSATDLAFSLLAAGLMTGAKSSNLPLLLPWLIAVAPAARQIIRRPLLLTLTALVAAACSFGPTAFLNRRHCGDWTGLNAEDAWIRAPNPGICILHNVMLIALQNTPPPIHPLAPVQYAWTTRLLPQGWLKTVDGFAEYGRLSYQVRELPGEEWAGLGPALTLLLAFQCLLSRRATSSTGSLGTFPPARPARWRIALLVSPYLALLAFIAKSGIAPVARLIAPYYLPGIPLLMIWVPKLAPTRRHSLRFLGWIAYASAALAVVLTPARPLWPALTTLHLSNARPASSMLDRARTVYSVYRNRPDAFAPLRDLIPPEEYHIGVVFSTKPETSLWRPYGSRRIRHVLKSDTSQSLVASGIHWVVLAETEVPILLGRSLADWIADMHAEPIARFDLRLLAGGEPESLVLVRLRAPAIAAPPRPPA